MRRGGDVVEPRELVASVGNAKRSCSRTDTFHTIRRQKSSNKRGHLHPKWGVPLGCLMEILEGTTGHRVGVGLGG